MEKEIPSSQEKNTKAGRLREAGQRLQALPFDRVPTEAEWAAVTGELSVDDLKQLEGLGLRHADRALDSAAAGEESDALEEARSALALGPRDPAWGRELISALQKYQWTSEGARRFFAEATRRSGRKTKRRSKLPGWLVPVLAFLVAAPLVAWGMVALWPGMNLGTPLRSVPGPRTLEASFDTQGVKTNIEVAQSRLMIFPESTVAEISAWVTFPDHRVDVWEGTVSVLDAQGKPLASREVGFRTSDQGPLEPGQGVEIFQQFDTWPWFDRVASFQVVTTKILAHEAHPRDRQELAVAGTDSLTPGYAFKVWIQDSQWVDRFASRVHDLSLEIENTGLKPFSELQFALTWVDPQGKVLKTQVLRPVSAFRTALPSGARLPWKQESVFDTEVFSWPPGGEPHPVLVLRSWH